MYIDIEKNEYPISLSDIYDRHPLTLMAEYLECYRLVKFIDQPEYDTVTEKLVEGFPIYNEDDGQWVQVWNIEKLPDDIIQSNLEEKYKLEREASFVSVTRRQGLLALFKLKKIKDSDVDAVIDLIEDEDVRYEAKVNWTGASTFDNQSEFVNMVANLLELTEDDLNNLFALARTL